MSSYQENAKCSLKELVAHVFTHKNRPLTGITYQDLAHRIGRFTKQGKIQAHGMGQVLGKMGHLLKGLADDWGEAIPHIQSLVIQKTGTSRGLPDNSIKEFWPDYPKLNRAEKENRTGSEYQKIAAFGSRWEDVLKKLGIESVATSTSQNRFGRGGESSSHYALKQYVRDHPEIVEAKAQWESFMEYALPSLDEIDVLFKSKDACVAVEVKSAISDRFPADYERGLYQTIKYRALLSAMARDSRYNMPANIRVVLVLESRLPSEYLLAAKALKVEIVENLKVKA